MSERPPDDSGRWNAVVRVLYALAAFLTAAAGFLTALGGRGHI